MNHLATSTLAKLTMSSQEIAELTGKEHYNVLQDIDRMLTALDLDASGYLEKQRHPQNGQTYRFYVLPKDLTITLVSGYSVVMRHRIVTRWQELETQVATPALPNFSPSLQLRAIDINGEPWFVAKDVCRSIEMDTSDATKYMDPDEQTLITNRALSTSRNGIIKVINESGLYSLILKSRKPEAKRFKKWVTSEVLPSIRKTGTYSAPQATTR